MTRQLSTLLLAAALAVPAFTTPILVPAQQPANINQALASLADQPATHTGFVFDRTMMQLAQGLLESNGMDAPRAAAALKSIAVDTYRYPQAAFYTPESMAALIASYRAAGWKHLVNVNQTPANSAQPNHPITDLWLHFTGADIDGVTVLSRAPHDMNVVQLSCDLRPLDLLHLSGHFGIPKVDPNAVMGLAPNSK